MRAQPQAGKKKILILSMSILVLTISIYYMRTYAYILLPLEEKLQLFCPLDGAHLAQEEPLLIPGTEYVDRYWTCPRSGDNLTVIVTWEMIDAGMRVFYCNTEDIFWVGVAQKEGSVFYGPCQGTLWKLTNDMTPLAGIILSAVSIIVSIIGIILSTIALFYSLTGRALPKKDAIFTGIAPLLVFTGIIVVAVGLLYGISVSPYYGWRVSTVYPRLLNGLVIALIGAVLVAIGVVRMIRHRKNTTKTRT